MRAQLSDNLTSYKDDRLLMNFAVATKFRKQSTTRRRTKLQTSSESRAPSTVLLQMAECAGNQAIVKRTHSHYTSMKAGKEGNVKVHPSPRTHSLDKN